MIRAIRYGFLVLYIHLMVNTVANAQLPLNIGLNINHGSSDTIYKGEPVVLLVALSNDFISDAMDWNIALDEHLESIRQDLENGSVNYEEYKQDSMESEATRRDIIEVVIGDKDHPWASQITIEVEWLSHDSLLKWDWEQMLFPESEVIAVLRYNSYYTAAFGLSPVVSEMLDDGNFYITASIGETLSNIVELKIYPQAIPEAFKGSQQMLLSIGYYNLNSGKPGAALKNAEAILELNPQSIGGMILSGEAYIQMDVNDLALKAFESALIAYFDQNPAALDLPEYLVSTIEYLKNR